MEYVFEPLDLSELFSTYARHASRSPLRGSAPDDIFVQVLRKDGSPASGYFTQYTGKYVMMGWRTSHASHVAAFCTDLRNVMREGSFRHVN